MKVKLAGHTQLSHKSADVYWKTPIGYREDGRPIFPMGGGAESDDDDDDADLDDDPDDDGDDNDDDDGPDLSESEKKLLTALESKLEKQSQSIADRLVNAQRTRERKEQRRNRSDGGGSGSGRTSAAAERRREEAERELKSDIRDGRLAFKDAIGDTGVRFASAEQRKAANEMGRALVEAAIRRGDDPDDAGADAAKAVAEMLRSAQKQAETSVMSRLEKQGVDLSKLKDSSGKGRQATRGPRQPGVGASVRAGEDKARELFPGRVAQAAGKQ